MEISTIGFDLAKNVFQVHAVDGEGRVVLQRRLRRSAVRAFFAGLPPCLVGMEACGSAHYWARELSGLGHEVKLLGPGDVQAYVRRNKTDAADAAAICEAVTRPHLRAVPVKSAAQQAVAVQHRVRDLLVRQRTQLINALRGHLSEFGLIAARGPGGLRALKAALAEASESALPRLAREVLEEAVSAIAALETRLARIDRAIVAANRADETARRLLTIPSVGPLCASAFAGLVADAAAFRSGRDFAAWLGLTPREHSSGGRQRLGRISKKGDRYLRRLLVVGATSILRRPDSAGPGLAAWIRALAARKPARLVTVALANKIARIVWACMARRETFRPSAQAAA
jgi:transposase